MPGMPMSLQCHCRFPSRSVLGVMLSATNILILNLCFTFWLCLQVPSKDCSIRPCFACPSALLKNYWRSRVMLSCLLPRIFSGGMQDQKPWQHSLSWNCKLKLRQSLCCRSVAWSQCQLTEILSAKLFPCQQLSGRKPWRVSLGTQAVGDMALGWDSSWPSDIQTRGESRSNSSIAFSL